jgi:soluble lytic murein transglycosylase-like protein
MYPAICRGRALDSCFLAAGLTLSACASTGPGAPPSLLPGVASAPAPATDPRTDAPKPAPAAAPRANAPKPTPAKRRAGKPAQPRVVLDSAALERAITKRLAHRPLAIALAPRMRHPELADRVAAAVIYEAGRARINPSVLAGVLVIENSRFDTSAVSTEGAIGLMQVMPMHIGNFRCLSGDLLNVEANICHGARLLHNHLRRSKSIELALRRYNGCVRGRNTPRCQRYPGQVLRTASRIRRETLVASASLEGEAATERRTSLSSLSTLPPDLGADSLASQAAKCDSILGCSKNRWTKPR